MQSDTAWARCPQCKSPDAYTPGEPCLHCRYVETDPQVIEYCRNAQLQIPRSAFLRCPRCKNPDAYTPGEKCLHCGYLERNRILVQRAKEFRYRIIPLMPSRDLTEMLKFRCSLGQLKKYRPVEGALLEYEYAFALLFSPKIRQVEALQNFYRVLARLGKALVKLLKNSRLSDHNRAVLTRLEQLNRDQFDALKEEFAKNNWALKKISLVHHYPPHTRKKDYFEKCTLVGDVLSALNGAASVGFKAANLLWGVAQSTMDTAGTVTTVGGLILAPFSVAENIARRKRDLRLKRQFQGTALKAGQTILDLPKNEQEKMIREAMNPRISGADFAKKWGGRIDYNNVRTWNEAAKVHRKGARRRAIRAGATVVGAGLALAACIFTCGTAAIVLGAGAATISVLKVGDSAKARVKKMSKSEKRTAAAREIVNSAMTGEINAINLLGGLDILKDPNHAKYIGFSDIYPKVVEDLKKYLNPA